MLESKWTFQAKRLYVHLKWEKLGFCSVMTKCYKLCFGVIDYYMPVTDLLTYWNKVRGYITVEVWDVEIYSNENIKKKRKLKDYSVTHFACYTEESKCH